jgi:acetaldehyde dehydrogenase (acetylating)
MIKKLNVAILGSGNIGTDLLIKVLRSPFLNCTKFIGRSVSSAGMKKAISLGVSISDRSIDAIIEDPRCCELIFDATSASWHKKFAPVFKENGIKAIDMTPSQIGKICVPSINLKECIKEDNINMITCGGQTSIPIAWAIAQTQDNVEYIEVVSSIASRSAGPGTRANIDEYISNTEKGLEYFTKCKKVKTILNLNPAIPCIEMQTTIFAKVDNPNMDEIEKSVNSIVDVLKSYVPGYKIVVPPVYENGKIVVTAKVTGLGDYLPKYAGNLDIINCAAISTAEEYARTRQ